MTDPKKQLAEALIRIDAVKDPARLNVEGIDDYTRDLNLVKSWCTFDGLRKLLSDEMETRLPELKILMITTAYEQGVGKGRDGYKSFENPYVADSDEETAWELGREEGVEQAKRSKKEPATPDQIDDNTQHLYEAGRPTSRAYRVKLWQEAEYFHGIKGE